MNASRSSAYALAAIVFALFGCDSEKACSRSGCGSYHNTTYATTGKLEVKGTIDVKGRRFDSSVGFHLLPRGNGTIDIDEQITTETVPPSCSADGGVVDAAAPDADVDVDAGDVGDAGEDSGDAGDAGSTVHESCAPRTTVTAIPRAHLALEVPDPTDEDDYDLDSDSVHAELWYCASLDAELDPVAERDGTIGPGCFEPGKDFVPAIREPLKGTLTVLAAPATLDDLRKGEDGFAYHYRIDTSADSAVQVNLDVSAWQKHKVSDCGDFF